MRSTRPILIAGAGIGGLAAALALADRGFRTRLIERRAVFGEAGAGIQIGPNGVLALRALGVADALERRVGKPDEIIIHDGRRGRALATLALGDAIAERLGAPYWTAHRADLHAALLDRAAHHDLIAITMGFAADRLEATTDGIRLVSDTGAVFTGSALIGADGLWSKVRGYVADRVVPSFAGRRAYRTVIPVADAPPAFRTNTTGLWLAPGAHVVHYPVRGGTEIALVVILTDTNGAQGWADTADPDVLNKGVARLAPAVVGLIGAAQSWKSWALFDMPPLARWSNGRIALLGDAAHPVLPFLAQGGVLALEDALILARAVDAAPADIPAALASYGKVRIARTARVRAASKRNGMIYHLSGATGIARNMVLRATPSPRLMRQYDWLYGWKP
jgi:salicylate hydroxylase